MNRRETKMSHSDALYVCVKIMGEQQASVVCVAETSLAAKQYVDRRHLHIEGPDGACGYCAAPWCYADGTVAVNYSDHTGIACEYRVIQMHLVREREEE
jgi:hypothetical protein